MCIIIIYFSMIIIIFDLLGYCISAYTVVVFIHWWYPSVPGHWSLSRPPTNIYDAIQNTCGQMRGFGNQQPPFVEIAFVLSLFAYLLIAFSLFAFRFSLFAFWRYDFNVHLHFFLIKRAYRSMRRKEIQE